MNEEQEKFECASCGCFYWVKDRNTFECPNCEDSKEENLDLNFFPPLTKIGTKTTKDFNEWINYIFTNLNDYKQ